MDKYSVYQDIAKRTEGDIYIGVVGPVRTGKSTFISKFMENFVIPNIGNKLQKQIAKDEMPQSASGKIVMTTQPKFVPANSVKVQFKNKISASVRLVDCVGYMVDGASGHIEDDKPRMVKTPWSDQLLPFEEAAEVGTKKVITEYSTIGILVTTDGSFGEIARENYVQSEERVVNELLELKKPFIIVLNSTKPESADCKSLALQLENKYGVTVVCADVNNLNAEQIEVIFEKILLEFPMSSFDVCLPKWMQTLPSDSAVISDVIGRVKDVSKNLAKMRDFPELFNVFNDDEYFSSIDVKELKLGQGITEYNASPKDGMFYRVLSEVTGETINEDYELMSYVKEASKSRKKFSKIKDALEQAENDGYGVVYPTIDEMNLEDPVLVKQGGKYGVKLKASAPSLHIMKVDVSTEVSPIVGTEKQGEDFVNFIMDKFQNNPSGIWETNMLGRPLNDLVNEGLNGKLQSVPKDTQTKMRKTLTRIVNENRGGVICILL